MLGAVAGANALLNVWFEHSLWNPIHISLCLGKKARIQNFLLLHLIVFIWGFTAILGANQFRCHSLGLV